MYIFHYSLSTQTLVAEAGNAYQLRSRDGVVRGGTVSGTVGLEGESSRRVGKSRT
jgi:hypothetical protein